MFKIGGNKIRHTKMCCRLVKHFFLEIKVLKVIKLLWRILGK